MNEEQIVVPVWIEDQAGLRHWAHASFTDNYQVVQCQKATGSFKMLTVTTRTPDIEDMCPDCRARMTRILVDQGLTLSETL
jgi:Zn finger protein HypA/HybF involved in hydrogenase expression